MMMVLPIACRIDGGVSSDRVTSPSRPWQPGLFHEIAKLFFWPGLCFVRDYGRNTSSKLQLTTEPPHHRQKQGAQAAPP
jgi:hypothetical protein